MRSNDKVLCELDLYGCNETLCLYPQKLTLKGFKREERVVAEGKGWSKINFFITKQGYDSGGGRGLFGKVAAFGFDKERFNNRLLSKRLVKGLSLE